MLARRLQIARYLNDGLTYADIREEIKVSDPTISRVQTYRIMAMVSAWL